MAKYNASTAALVNRLDTDNELAKEANISIAQAYEMYEAELKQNRCVIILRQNQQGLYMVITNCGATPCIMTVCASIKACS